MRRPLAVSLALMVVALPLSACGESENDRYIDDFKPLNDRLLRIGDDLGKALEGADSKSDDALATQFDGLAKKLDDIRAGIRDLDTPADLEDESKGLSDAMDTAVADLERIAEAARDGDAQGAASATVKLATDAQTVNKAQNKLAKATGAEVGDR